MYRTFNMGIGLCVVCEPGRAEEVLQCVAQAGLSASRIGHIAPGGDTATVAWASPEASA